MSFAISGNKFTGDTEYLLLKVKNLSIVAEQFTTY